LDEELPVDGPVSWDATESPEIGRIVGTPFAVTLGGEDGAALDGRVEPVQRADHGVPESKGGDRELDGHEHEAVLEAEAGVEPGQPGSGLVEAGEDAPVRGPVDDLGREVGAR